MPSPTRTNAGGYKARKRIPNDVRADFKRLYGTGLEAKWSMPPGTKEAAARQGYAEWLAEYEGRVKAIRAARDGTGLDLTEHEARRLAGDWYEWWTARHNKPDGVWLEELAAEMQGALESAAGVELLGHAGGDPTEAWKLDEGVRERVRPVVADIGETAQFLASKGIVLANASRARFLDFLVTDIEAALKYLKRRSGGDYSPDPHKAQFPKPQATTADSGLLPWELFERWIAERKPADSTVENWRSYFRALDTKFPNRAAASISGDEAEAWVKTLPTERRTAEAVKKTWLRAFTTVFNWAIRHKLVGVNPFAGIEITVSKKPQLRETKAFRDSEVALILTAAAAIADMSNPDDAAKRWVPWLGAYTGARPGELTQLRKRDVFREGNLWALKLTPEAGTIKSGKARVVPLHEHLLAQGFVEFVQSRNDGPIFYRSRTEKVASDKTQVRKSPAAQARQRLAAWVRQLGVTDTGVSPNHGWRHTFKRNADKAGISEKVSDYITGHSTKSEARGYGEPTPQDMADALKTFPRYQLNTSTTEGGVTKL